MFKKKTLGFLAIAIIIGALAFTLGACEEESEPGLELGKAAIPVANPPGGTYSGNQLVTLTSATEGAVIFYTTDGSAPTTNSALYSGSIAISAATTIRAIAVRSGMDNSDVMTAAYTITNPDLGPLTAARWLTILQGIEADGSFDGTLDLSHYTRSESPSGGGLRSDGVFDPDNNIAIGKGKIVSIILPSTAIEIAGGTGTAPTFRHFTGLETFNGATLSVIGDYAFAGSTSLTITTLPTWLTSIGNNAFQGCTSLTEITLPAGLSSIGNSAFQGCTSFALVTSPVAAPPALGVNAFSNTHSRLVIRVPEGSVKTYQEASGWDSYSYNIIAVGPAPVITINSQPAATTDIGLGFNASLSVSASVTSGAMLRYQWYSNTSNSSTGGTAISGATSASYTIPANLTIGNTYYYFCEVRATGADSIRSNVATVTVRLIGMVWIPGGTFTMGSNDSLDWGAQPPHQVTLTSGFYMGVYQVTQGQWVSVMGSNPSIFRSNPAAGEVQGRRPVEGVSWYDAVVFCNRLSILEGLTPAYRIDGSTNPNDWGTVPTSSNTTWDAVEIVSGSTGYRLPTEAQWEYAAKGGDGSPGSFIYSGSNDPNAVGWYSSNSNSCTHEVGLKQANGLGLYDMSGNVGERCWDWYSDYTSDDKTDTTGTASGDYRVFRGGSFYFDASFMRSAFRDYSSDPSGRYGNVGFRLVRP